MGVMMQSDYEHEDRKERLDNHIAAVKNSLVAVHQTIGEMTIAHYYDQPTLNEEYYNNLIAARSACENMLQSLNRL